MLVTGSEKAATLRFVSYPDPVGSTQVHREHQAVTKATHQEGQNIDRRDDGEGGIPVAVVAVIQSGGGSGGGGEV